MFTDIKVGDLVLVPVSVQRGWSGGKSFMTRGEVTRVTPKQFAVGEVKFWKVNGRVAVSSAFYRAVPYDKDEDQTQEWMDYTRFRKKAGALQSATYRLNISDDWTEEDVDTCLELIRKYKNK